MYGSARGGATGQTGVKGVLRDQEIAEEEERAERIEKERERRRVWMKGDLGGLTWAEEEEIDRRMKLASEGLGEEDEEDERRGGRERGTFGHLREVVESNFVKAVEGEAKDTWVVMHIYHPVSLFIKAT